MERLRINTDEMAGKNWRDSKIQIKVAKEAILMREEAFKKGLSLNQETTLSGKSIIKALHQAKKLGYQIHLYYVGLESAELAKERIKIRVLNGGHNISDEAVERRYFQSLENFKKLLELCTYIELFDNSLYFRRILQIEGGKIILLEENNLPLWIEKLLSELSLRK